MLRLLGWSCVEVRMLEASHGSLEGFVRLGGGLGLQHETSIPDSKSQMLCNHAKSLRLKCWDPYLLPCIFN